jgi:hypothetical protein
LARLGFTSRAKKNVEDELGLLNVAPELLLENAPRRKAEAAILRNMILPQLGTSPKLLTGGKGTPFVSGYGTQSTLRTTGGVPGASGLANIGPLSAYLGNQGRRTGSGFLLGHENAHIVQKLYQRLGMESPALPSPKNFNYGTYSNARIESGAMLTDSLYDLAINMGTGKVRPYFPPEITLDKLVSMSLNSNSPAGRKDIKHFAKNFLVPNAPRRHQFDANWFDEYIAGVSSSKTIKPPHSSSEMKEMLRLREAMRGADLTNQTRPTERAGAMVRMIWNEVSQNGVVRPSDDIMKAQMAFSQLMSKEAKKRSNRLKPENSSAPSAAQSQSEMFISSKDLQEIGIPLDVDYVPGIHAHASNFKEHASGQRFFVKEHIPHNWNLEGELKGSFDSEFLAGRIGEMIGAKTPQSFIVKPPEKRVMGSVATKVIPSSMGLNKESLRQYIVGFPNASEIIEEMLEAYARYNQKTPALNAAFYNKDFHANNVMWSDKLREFMQIDYGQSNLFKVLTPDGMPLGGYMARETLEETAGSSMAAIRNGIAIAADEAIDWRLISRNEQIKLAQTAREMGFNVGLDRQAVNPLRNQFYKMDVATDLTEAFTEISKIDPNRIPTAAFRELGVDKIRGSQLGSGLVSLITQRAGLLAEHGKYVLKGSSKVPKESTTGFQMGGIVPKNATGGMFKSMGTDTIPAMLTPGEYVVKRSAVQNFGVDNLEKINSGTYNDGSVYNYNLAVNVKSDSDPNKIARAVITNIKSIENQRVRGNRL